MKKFMDEDFLLKTDVAKELFHRHSEKKPIYDYHCHLNPEEIAQDKRFDNISTLWLGTRTFGDHYKWRAMRSNGLTEQVDDPWLKFYNWAQTMENLYGNPLFHWTQLELKRYFGIDDVLTTKTAKMIYDECNRQLRDREDLSVFGIFRKFNVYAVGTTDDPADSLEHHIALQGRSPAKVIPSFRPDKAMNIEQETFAPYIQTLSKAAGIQIKSAEDVLAALENRLDFFVRCGCRASDHALTDAPYAVASEARVNAVFKKAMNKEPLSPLEAEQYRFYILKGLGRLYAKRGIVMQLHMAAIRNNNSRKFCELGADTGYDSVGDSIHAEKLSKLLDSMEKENLLPKTVLYSLNPNDYYVMGSLMGCFQGEGVPGKIQMGSAWWFCDHRDGMEQQMKSLGNLGLLSRFVGMLTDSRSFLSYPRHEYFRRIMCNIIGTWVEDGEVPYDEDILGRMVEGISFDNALAYFG